MKTQGSLPNDEAGLKLLYDFHAGGLIRLRRVNACKQMPTHVDRRRQKLQLETKSLDKAARKESDGVVAPRNTLHFFSHNRDATRAVLILQ